MAANHQILETYDFNVNFILTVKKYPAVYNFNLRDYSNRTIVEKAWQAIALEVNCSTEQCKVRWKHIRNSFLRHLRNQLQSGSETLMKKPYYLESYLGFLVPFTKSKKKTGNMGQEEADNQDEQNLSPVYSETESMSTCDDIASENHSFTAENEEQGQKKLVRHSFIGENEKGEMRLVRHSFIGEKEERGEKRPASHSFIGANKERKEIRLVQSETDIRTKKNNEHSENLGTKFLWSKLFNENDEKEQQYLHFFKSLLPELMRFDRKQSLTFRIKILDLIENILGENTI